MRTLRAFLLVTALIMSLGAVALAHDHDDDDRRGWGQNQNNDAREYGYHNGYRDGFSHGRQDRARRAGYDISDDDYRRGERGYDSYMGPRGQYKKGYRSGYKQGYDDAFYGRRSQYNWVYGQNGRRTPWDPDGDGDVHSPPLYPNAQYGGNYGNDGNAQRFGYQDGLQAGQRDRSGRHSYRPTEWEAYRDADHGMSSSTGYRSSDDYKAQYRNAFMNGYNQGYGRR